uniref:DH domain-containing protein n=1 Tax=Caenorhabditis tropicalis TaxID=1561998 RepID=A0A1I7T4C3_9PELO
MRLLAATACPAAFVDLDSIREEPSRSSSRHHFDVDRDDSVFFRESCSSSNVGSPLDDVAPLPTSSNSSPFKFMESIQRKRKSMFKRNQSSSCLINHEKRRTCRRPSLPSIPPTIDEMSSSVGHARSRRPSLHNDWTNEHHLRERGNMAMLDNRIHHIDIEPQVNYFIAIFKDLDDRNEDYIEHIRFDYNQRLYEVFEPYLRSRGLTINDVEFFLEKSSTPIPDCSAVHFLAGQKIFVRGRGNMKVVRHTRAAHSMDESNDRATRKMSAEAVSRKSSFVNSRILNRGSRNHPTLNGSDDAECRSNDSSLSVRDGWQYDEPSCSEPVDDGGTRRARSVTSSRISLNFFGKEKNEMLKFLNQRKEETQEYATYKLEKDWREIVNNHQNLSDKNIKQQEAIWEIVTTEHRYIKLLRYITDLSMYLTDLQCSGSGILKDVDNRLVFYNFVQLHNVNYECLWAQSIEPLLRHSRETGEPLDVNFLHNGFRDIENWSRCYTHFHVHLSESLKHIQKMMKDSELFREFVSWAESQENLERQRLIDTLSQPMQRLTRYPLLLRAVLKVTVDENECEMLRNLVECSEKATKQLNCEMNNNDLRAKLGNVMRTIEGPDFVDLDEIERLFGVKIPLNLGDYMPLLHPRTPINREIFHRGDLRMQEGKKGSKVDVHCMIFTDMFLICRKVQGKKDRLKILKPPIHSGKLVFHYFNDQNGFHLLAMTDFNTPAALYSMHTSCPEETLRWTDKLKMAIDEFKKIHSASWSRNEQRDSPLDEYGREYSFDGQNGFGSQRMMPPGYMNQQNVIHRKASSMDSQAVAAASYAHSHLHYMHRSSAASSYEQLDRHPNGSDKCTPPRHKLSVASCHANPLSSSKSSVDLYVSLGAENGDAERPRSRSNSSGPDIEGLKQRSRSSSPAHKETGTPAEIESPQTSTPCRDSPTLLITSDDCVEPSHSGRRFEKRYHTADGIDVLKPKGSMLSGLIQKRFSWNVTSAVGGSSRKRLESSRRISSAAVTQGSMDSFGSSTSGISTASSTNNNNDPTMEAMATKLSHISTISINDTPTSIEPQATLSISLEAPSVVLEKDESEPQQSIEVTVPPSPDVPPPSKTPSPNLPSQKPEKVNPKCQDLMKFILDNNLETSDV